MDENSRRDPREGEAVRTAHRSSPRWPQMTNDFLKKSKIKGTSSPWQKGLIVNRESRVRIGVSPDHPTTNRADHGAPGPRSAAHAPSTRSGGRSAPPLCLRRMDPLRRPPVFSSTVVYSRSSAAAYARLGLHNGFHSAQSDDRFRPPSRTPVKRCPGNSGLIATLGRNDTFLRAAKMSRTTGTAPEAMMSASTWPGATEGSWSTSPTISTAASSGTAASSATHRHDVHHRGLVDDQQAAVERIVRIAREAAGPRIDREQPVDGPGLQPGDLAHPPPPRPVARTVLLPCMLDPPVAWEDLASSPLGTMMPSAREGPLQPPLPDIRGEASIPFLGAGIASSSLRKAKRAAVRATDKRSRSPEWLSKFPGSSVQLPPDSAFKILRITQQGRRGRSAAVLRSRERAAPMCPLSATARTAGRRLGHGVVKRRRIHVRAVSRGDPTLGRGSLPFTRTAEVTARTGGT